MTYHKYTGGLVTILSCSSCSVNCAHCYISYNGCYTGDRLYQTAKELMKGGYRVQINGSEPLEHKEFLRTFQLIHQTNVMTSGLVFKGNYEYLNEIQEYGINCLNISYHFDLHDDVSPVPSDYLMALWEEILRRKMYFTINCTISTRNMHSIEKYCEEAFSYGASRIRFTNLIRQGSACAMNHEIFLDHSQVEYVLDSISKARKLYSPDRFYIERCGSFGPGKDIKKYACPSGVNRVFLTPDNKVYPCVFLAETGCEIGFFREGEIYIYDSIIFDEKRCMAIELYNQSESVSCS